MNSLIIKKEMVEVAIIGQVQCQFHLDEVVDGSKYWKGCYGVGIYKDIIMQ